MELSEAGTPGSGKGRGGDTTLEEETLAGNKKKPPHLEPTWPFSMKVGFCSSPIFAGHGPRGDRLRSCIISTGETESRPSRPLASRPRSDIWGFTSNFKERISRPLMWPSFCAIFCSTSVDMWSSYGTKLSSIGGNRSMTSSTAIQGSMWNGFLDMLLSSIRWNLYGLRPNADWPIAPQKERMNLSECWAALPDDSNVLNVSFGLVSGPLICLGKDNIFSINYA